MRLSSRGPHARLVRRLRLVALIACLGALPAWSVTAQVTISQVQPLAFGYLTQGLTEVVPYTDTFRRGVVTLDGTSQVWIRVVLPVSLLSPQGVAIPLQFLTGDIASQENGRPALAFDPATSTRVNLGRGTASLFIGGRAVPATNQPAGLYTATVTVIVSLTKF